LIFNNYKIYNLQADPEYKLTKKRQCQNNKRTFVVCVSKSTQPGCLSKQNLALYLKQIAVWDERQ